MALIVLAVAVYGLVVTEHLKQFPRGRNRALAGLPLHFHLENYVPGFLPTGSTLRGTGRKGWGLRKYFDIPVLRLGGGGGYESLGPPLLLGGEHRWSPLPQLWPQHFTSWGRGVGAGQPAVPLDPSPWGQGEG